MIQTPLCSCPAAQRYAVKGFRENHVLKFAWLMFIQVLSLKGVEKSMRCWTMRGIFHWQGLPFFISMWNAVTNAHRPRTIILIFSPLHLRYPHWILGPRFFSFWAGTSFRHTRYAVKLTAPTMHLALNAGSLRGTKNYRELFQDTYTVQWAAQFSHPLQKQNSQTSIPLLKICTRGFRQVHIV